MTDILTFGEALVEVMRTDVDQPLNQPELFTGPYPSGAPFIFAAQAARLGASVQVVGSVGNDAFGECLLKQLREDGISTDAMQVLDNHTTGVAFVAYNRDGSRNFVFSLGAGGQIHPDMLDENLFVGLRCLHIMGSTLSIHADALATGHKALRLAQAAGAKISFDPNIRPELLPVEQAREAFQPFIHAADVLLPTADELRLLTGYDDLQTAAHHLFERKPDRIIIVTRGAKGCSVLTRQSGMIQVPGFPVGELDPTGAGDCFDAGFLVRWLAGDSAQDAARFANACGALAVMKKGPMAGAEKLSVVENFMEGFS